MKTFVLKWAGILAFTGILYSCEKDDPYDQLYWDAFNSIVLTCPEAEADYFIEGELDGQPFCYQVGVNEQEFFAYFPNRDFSIPDPDNPDSMIVLLKTGSFEFGIWPKPTTWDHLDHFIRIQSPIFQQGSQLAYLQTMHHLEDLPIQSSEMFARTGFRIDLEVKAQANEWSGGFAAFYVSTAQGPQDDSFMQVTEAYHISDGIHEFYHFDIAFECDLYHTKGGRDHYGKITNGRIRVAFEL